MTEMPSPTIEHPIASSDPEQIVRDFLDAIQRRDLQRARSLVEEGFKMTFPGPSEFEEFEDLVAWAKERYRTASKVYDRFEMAPGDGCVVVYCFGTLQGEWLDGSRFSGVRFIDRFTLRDGKIVDQMVWNDMEEVRSL